MLHPLTTPCGKNISATLLTLYDLTNTCFEGEAGLQPKARRGHSKDKRTDCPLPTLGLVLDASGFVRRSQIFAGNVREPHTLAQMLDALNAPRSALVVMDRHTEWDEATLWRTYFTLTDIEAVFRSLKSELGLRPIYHHKPLRAEGHLFLTVIAYQLVQVIRRRLRQTGQCASWTQQGRLAALALPLDLPFAHTRRTLQGGTLALFGFAPVS